MPNWSFNPFTNSLDISGSSAVVFEGEVATFADLPVTVGDPAVGAAYLVRESTGVWLVNRRQAGIYIRRNNAGLATDWEYGGDYPVNSVNGQSGNVVLGASSVGAAPSQQISSQNISGDTLLVSGRNKLIYLTATGGTTTNITLPYSGNQNGDTFTLIPVFVGPSSIGSLTIRSAGQMAGGSPLGYLTLATLTTNGQAVTLVSDGSNGFGGWSVVSVGGSFPTTNDAVQEYDVTGVLLPNGDTGSGVQLTRNTAIPQAPDGSDRTFNAEQLIYTRSGGNSVRMDTFLKDKSAWFWTSVPATKTSAGTTSQVAYDANYFYICVATNKWVRIPMATNW